MLTLLLVVYGVSAAPYAFRMILKYFQYLEGQIRNGTIITNGIAAGLIWPLTLILDGLRGIWEEIGPVKIIEAPQAHFHDGDTLPMPVPPQSVAEILNNNTLENLSEPH